MWKQWTTLGFALAAGTLGYAHVGFKVSSLSTRPWSLVPTRTFPDATLRSASAACPVKLDLEHEVVAPPGVAMTLEWDDKAYPAGTIELLVLDADGKNPHGTRLVFRWDKGGNAQLPPMKSLELLNPTTLVNGTAIVHPGICAGDTLWLNRDSYAAPGPSPLEAYRAEFARGLDHLPAALPFVVLQTGIQALDTGAQALRSMLTPASAPPPFESKLTAGALPVSGNPGLSTGTGFQAQQRTALPVALPSKPAPGDQAQQRAALPAALPFKPAPGVPAQNRKPAIPGNPSMGSAPGPRTPMDTGGNLQTSGKRSRGRFEEAAPGDQGKGPRPAKRLAGETRKPEAPAPAPVPPLVVRNESNQSWWFGTHCPGSRVNYQTEGMDSKAATAGSLEHGNEKLLVGPRTVAAIVPEDPKGSFVGGCSLASEAQGFLPASTAFFDWRFCGSAGADGKGLASWAVPGQDFLGFDRILPAEVRVDPDGSVTILERKPWDPLDLDAAGFGEEGLTDLESLGLLG
jgi:hypothetical protein